MENNEITKNWPVIKEQIKKDHPELTDEELVCEIGKEAELLHRLQIKLGKNKKEIDNWLKIMG